MTLFRPCIDLHQGKVKQIVGSTLRDSGGGSAQENFVSDKSAGWYADLYRRDALSGGHVIMLGTGNEDACLEALRAYPGGLHVGGGIRPSNATYYLEAGASHVIVTSYLFDADGHFCEDRLLELFRMVGKEHLVLDLSCRATDDGWAVAMNRWQTMTDLTVNQETISHLTQYCSEFLIHSVDVEGKCQGVDLPLLKVLADWCEIPITYAGGARNLADLQLVEDVSKGRIDVTIGSSLDIFGGKGVTYQECVAFNRRTH